MLQVQIGIGNFAEKFSQATNFELRFDEKDIYTWNYRKDATKNTLELVRIRLNKYITKFYA